MEQIQFNEEQRRVYRAAHAPQATDEQYDFFITECERRALIPGTHVVFNLRKASEYNMQLQRYVDVFRPTLITTINALRLIAERTKKFEGYGNVTFYYCDDSGQPTVKSIIPLGRIPHAVTVELYRTGWRNAVLGVARFDACVQLKSDKNPTAMWFKRGEEQLAKCAEADGLRKVAPEECGGLYIEEEMASAGKEEAAPAADITPTVIPAATVAPAVNQSPAPLMAQRFDPTGDPPGRAPDPAIKLATAATPVKPAVPRPPAPAVKPAPAVTPAPAPAAPVKATSPQETGDKQRVAHVDDPVQEPPAEMAEFADRLARDTTPAGPVTLADELEAAGNAAAAAQAAADTQKPAPVTGPITDADLPAGLGEPPAPKPPRPVVPTQVQPAVPTQVNSAGIADSKNRMAKIVRDKLEGAAKLKNAGPLVKAYLSKKSGQADIKKIDAAIWLEVVNELEAATPEQAADIVKG